MHGKRPTSSRAFTMIELIVVIVILALIAGMMIPRFARTREREFRLVMEEVQDLVMMYAQREMLGEKPVGLWYDSEQHQLEVQILEVDPARPDSDQEWRIDISISPVTLPDWVDAPAVLADDLYIDVERWPLTTEPGQRRPRVEVALRTEDNITASVILMPQAISPRIYGLDAMQQVPDRSIIDLDAAGRSREDW